MLLYIYMPTKPKHNYNIEIVQRLENQGLSIRAIARANKWPENALNGWLTRNFNRHNENKVWYTRKADK